MRIERGQIIAGFPAKKVRDAIKNVAFRCSWGCMEYFAARLGCSEEEGKEFIANMVAQGYLVRDRHRLLDKNKKYYRTTIKGNSLAQAKATRPVKRATAKKKVAEIIGRAKEINSSDYVYKVTSLIVFGSYLSDSETVNDIDLTIELDCTYKDRDAHRKAIKRSIERATRDLWSYMEEISWPKMEVYQKLRQRSSVYSFHERDEIDKFLEDDKDFKYETIYELRSG